VLSNFRLMACSEPILLLAELLSMNNIIIKYPISMSSALVSNSGLNFVNKYLLQS